jgi:serine phosphatase RsbU (regulator of sigma subunit)
MRKKLFTLIILFFTAYNINAQSFQIQTLENKLKSLKGESRIAVLDQLSEAYLDFDTDKSIKLANEVIDIAKKYKTSTLKIHGIYNTLGVAYYYQEKFSKSLKYFEDELRIIEVSSSEKEISKAYYNIAVLYQKTGKSNKAVFNYGKSLSYAHKVNSFDLLIKNHKALYELYLEDGNEKDALTQLQKYIALKDSKFYRTNKRINILRKQYTEEKEMREMAENVIIQKDSALAISENIEKELIKDTTEQARLIELLKIENEFTKQINEKKVELSEAVFALKNAEIERRKLESILLSVIILFVLVGSIWLYLLYKAKKKANVLLAEQKAQIVTQSEIIMDRNTQITDSINYARRIQDSILIPESEIQKYLPDTFIYYQPKDIVSGDFYWFSKVDDELVLAAIDCTGHGVPGAFMSMIGHTLLNEIINEKRITKPDIILKHLHLGVKAALQQTGNDSASDDGMDMSLCVINPILKRFRFAGAKNHLYVLQKDKLKVLKANLHSIGGRPIRSDAKIEFSSYDFMYDENTSIYMLSDGYMDQFGGKQDSKFNSNRFKELLINNRELPMIEQKEVIKNTFQTWKGNRDQVDDILVMGVKLS